MRTYLIKLCGRAPQPSHSRVNACQAPTTVYTLLTAHRYGNEEADDHLWCHQSLNWLPYPLVMRVSRRVTCGNHDAARHTTLHGQSSPKRDHLRAELEGRVLNPPLQNPPLPNPLLQPSYTPIPYHAGDTPGSPRRGRIVTVTAYPVIGDDACITQDALSAKRCKRDVSYVAPLVESLFVGCTTPADHIPTIPIPPRPARRIRSMVDQCGGTGTRVGCIP